MTLTAPFGRWMNSWRSYRIGLSASRLCGRSFKLEKAGRLHESLRVAREGLTLLADPKVERQNPAEGSVLVVLAIQAEHLAEKLGESGAAARDLADAIQYLQSMPPRVKGRAGEVRRDWLPYFEARLAYVSGHAPTDGKAAEQ
jgi:hypothetical protein